MTKTIFIGGNTLMQMVKQLHDRGEITDKQFDGVVKRHAMMSARDKSDVVYLN